MIKNTSMKPASSASLGVEKPPKSEIVGVPMNARPDPSETQPLLAAAKQHLYANYAQPELVMSHGQGAQLWDTEGRRYVDFFAGIAVSTLGHAHPALVEAISSQAAELIHLSNYFYTAPNLELAQLLCELSGFDRAFFCNSGTEANEAALKLVRRHFFDHGQKERDVILAFENSFHGRTIGSLTATGQPKYRTGFGPIGGVVHVPFGDLEKTRAALSDRVAGILFEPIQGEGGVVPAAPEFLHGLRALCDESGAFLIADEIQTGVGRTGHFLACHRSELRADVVTLAKALGGGVPIGAMLCREKLASALPPGSHGTTFGGNPLASRAALTVLQTLKSEGLLARVVELGQRLQSQLDSLVEKHELLASRRGQGLLQGLVLTDPSVGGSLLSALREAGLLVTFAGGVAIRLTPPLTISDAELDEGLAILDQVLGTFS